MQAEDVKNMLYTPFWLEPFDEPTWLYKTVPAKKNDKTFYLQSLPAGMHVIFFQAQEGPLKSNSELTNHN